MSVSTKECFDNRVVSLQVYDYDRFSVNDDFMGSAILDPSQFTFWKPFEQKLLLEDDNSVEEYMGYINVQVTIEPQTEGDKNRVGLRSFKSTLTMALQFLQSMSRAGADVNRKVQQTKSQVWTSVANIVLVEAKNLLPTDRGHNAPLPDPFVKFKLGSEKYKSKVRVSTASSSARRTIHYSQQ